MSWMHGSVDPPNPHPHLEMTTRAFYGVHNALPIDFWPQCHHGDDTVVHVYEHFGMPDDASSAAHISWSYTYNLSLFLITCTQY
jgi:hypothetical protein